MTRRWLLLMFAWAGLLGLAAPAAAQEASPELRAAGERVVALLKGEVEPEEILTPAFLQAVPAGQIRATIQQWRAEYGATRGLARLEARSPTIAAIHVDTERAVLAINLAIEPQAPHRIEGLQLTGAEPRGDTLAAVTEAIAALPGRTSFAVARLGDGAPQLIASREPDRPLAIASTYKLFILAELSRQVRAGQRRWNDVVSLDRRSVPSGMLQNWPAGSPLTLHSLAALMISISDNTATDMLLHLAGRENVERMMTRIGIEAASRNRPLLGALEITLLKAAGEADFRAWLDADEAERRRLLAARYAARDPAGLNLTALGNQPLRIEQLEWFASAADLVRTMDWFRRNGDETALGILAISPFVAPAQRRDFAYLGYKGGSELGVLSQTWLARNRAGVWHVVTGSWNNPAAALEEARFEALMQRALLLVR